MKILSLCGSLRKNSSNWAILNAAQRILSHASWDEINLSSLPYFDPDQQFTEATPESVREARYLASEADLIFISTPEYAHGIPGILKNGLEWIFHEGTQRKPVALVIGAAQGEFARDSLIEVLRTMDFVIAPEHAIIIRGARSKIAEDGTFIDSSIEEKFTQFCKQFSSH